MTIRKWKTIEGHVEDRVGVPNLSETVSRQLYVHHGIPTREEFDDAPLGTVFVPPASAQELPFSGEGWDLYGGPEDGRGCGDWYTQGPELLYCEILGPPFDIHSRDLEGSAVELIELGHVLGKLAVTKVGNAEQVERLSGRPPLQVSLTVFPDSDLQDRAMLSDEDAEVLVDQILQEGHWQEEDWGVDVNEATMEAAVSGVVPWPLEEFFERRGFTVVTKDRFQYEGRYETHALVRRATNASLKAKLMR